MIKIISLLISSILGVALGYCFRKMQRSKREVLKGWEKTLEHNKLLIEGLEKAYKEIEARKTEKTKIAIHQEWAINIAAATITVLKALLKKKGMTDKELEAIENQEVSKLLQSHSETIN